MDWIKQFIDYKGISVLKFEKSIGVRSTIGKAIANKSSLRGDILAKIIEAYPDINASWLLSGKGDMIKVDYLKKNVVINQEDLSEADKMMITIECIYLEEDKLLKLPLFKTWLDNKEKTARNKGLRDYLQSKKAIN